MLNSQRSEDGSTPAVANGVPGTASNLPRPTSRPGGGAGNPLYRRTENTTFQTSRVVRHIKFPHGQIKRLSVSVLLDHSVKTVGGKQTVEAPPPERVRAIKELVSATVGFQQERGDQIIVESLPFDAMRNPPVVAGGPAATAAPERPGIQLPPAIPAWLRIPMEGHLNWLVAQSWMPGVVLLIVAVILFLVYKIVRAIGRKTGAIAGKALGAAAGKIPFLKKKGQHVDVTLDPSIEGGPAPAQLEAGETHDGVEHKSLIEQLRERDQLQEKLTQDALAQLDVPKAEVRKAEVLTRHVIDMVAKDPEAVANLIRTWMEAHN
jgi:flagellar M-ring protein FliF